MGRENTSGGDSFRARLSLLAFACLILRLGYVAAQPSTDPNFAHPMLDGAVYLNWARDLAAGSGGPAGAFYHAPLYPYFLSFFLRVFGERFGLLYFTQHLMVVGGACALGFVGRRAAGSYAGLATAALCMLHQPLVFFASRPLAEPLAVLASATALAVAVRQGTARSVLAGGLAGLAALARPGLLALPVAWAAWDGLRRRSRTAALVLAGATLAVVPVTVRNWIASGHLVPVSANAGITAFHGNGPGARGGYTAPLVLAGNPLRQREEATATARKLSGLDLDPVEADRWWWRQAVRVRLENPADTLRLAVRRVALLADDYQHGLDYPPRLDDNPWRLSLRWADVRRPTGRREIDLVPFGLLVGLAGAGLYLGGFRGSGGERTWCAIGAAALAPLVFYVSSRYRLPFAVFLTVPAGAGLVLLSGARAGFQVPRAKRFRAAVLAVALASVSFSVPSSDLVRVETAGALLNRSHSFRKVGDLAAAERDVRRSLEVNPRSAPAHLSLGLLFEADDRTEQAEDAYRQALEMDSTHAPSAARLAQLLVNRGAAAEAVPPLLAALGARPAHRECWMMLVVALAARGDVAEARRALAEAERIGVVLDEVALLEGAKP